MESSTEACTAIHEPIAPRDRALAFHEQARAANFAGRPRTAIRLVRQGLKLVETPLTDPAEEMARRHTEARLRISEAFILMDRLGFEEAVAIVDRVIARAEADHDDGIVAVAHAQRGMLLGRANRLTEARTALDVALAQRDRLPGRDVCVALTNRGIVHAMLGRVDDAAADFDEAAQIAQERGLPSEHWLALHNLGYALYLRGDFPGALHHMARAGELGVEVADVHAWVDQARVLADAGLVGEALDLLRSAAASCDPAGQRLTLADIHLDLARAHRMLEHTELAQRHAEEASRILRGTRSPSARNRARVTALELRLARGEDPALVAHAARRLRANALAHGEESSAREAAIVLVEALVAGHRWREANQADVSLPERASGYSVTQWLRLVRVRAELAVQAGDRAKALRLLRRAAVDLDEALGHVGSIDIRTARGRHARNLVELDLALNLSAGPAALFASTERWRAATARMPAVHPPEDAEIARLTARLRSIHDRIREAEVTHTPLLAAEARKVERQIRAREWTFATRDDPRAAGTTPPVSWRVAREALAALDVEVASFFTVGDVMFRLAVCRGRARVEAVGGVAETTERLRRVQADLRVLLGQRLGPLEANVTASLHAGLEALDAQLIGRSDLGDRPLLIVPSRVLAPLPWALLPSLRGVPVTVGRSVTSFLRDTHTSPAGEVAVVTGPGVTSADDEMTSVAAAWDLPAPRGAGLGKRGRGDAAGRRVTCHPLAPRHQLIAALGRAQLVHVAAHGRHRASSPLFSSLELSDGALFAHEIEGPGVAAEHVSLSACDVGAATVRIGEEALGMAATLLTLGASCVVAPLTRVPDRLAAEVMVRHHRELARGRHTDEALAAAVEASGPLAGVFGAFGARWRALPTNGAALPPNGAEGNREAPTGISSR